MKQSLARQIIGPRNYFRRPPKPENSEVYDKENKSSEVGKTKFKKKIQI